jgi:hypothetical protein
MSSVSVLGESGEVNRPQILRPKCGHVLVSGCATMCIAKGFKAWTKGGVGGKTLHQSWRVTTVRLSRTALLCPPVGIPHRSTIRIRSAVKW